MCPEYGATVGFFPVDEMSLKYLRQTGEGGGSWGRGQVGKGEPIRLQMPVIVWYRDPSSLNPPKEVLCLQVILGSTI